MLSPIYTVENVKLAYQLRWSLAVFWNQGAPSSDSWLPALQMATESDGVRILEHRFTKESVSQFLISTKPNVSPANCIRSVKGRLQYLIRDVMPRPFRRNYSICSIGEANRAAIENYVATQTQHHQMADSRINAILAPHQFSNPGLNLALARRSGHGVFTYNLHMVVVHEERYGVVSNDYLHRTRAMVEGVARKKNHLLSQLGLLVDHVHWTIGCNVAESPLEIGLSYLNNLAFAHGMQPVFQVGFYVGTFGSYDMTAVRMKSK